MFIVSSIVLLFILVTSSQIDRLWNRFTSLDQGKKGYLRRQDLLSIPELAVNPLGDRIVHAFFTDTINRQNERLDHENDVLKFYDFVNVMAHFQPVKTGNEHSKRDLRQEKVKCKYITFYQFFNEYINQTKT